VTQLKRVAAIAAIATLAVVGGASAASAGGVFDPTACPEGYKGFSTNATGQDTYFCTNLVP